MSAPGRLPDGARAAERLRPARRPRRGRRAAGARVERRAADCGTASRRRAPARERARRRRREPTARCGFPTAGSPSRRARRVGDGAQREPGRALQILISRLTGAAEEMGAVLRRAAYSPNIKERADCSAALFTAAGELLGAGGAHSGSPRFDAGGGRGRHRRDRGAPRPGDEIVLNDPFAGGTHLNDVTLVSPCFVRRRARRAGWPTVRTTPISAGWHPVRCRPRQPRSTRRASASRRSASTTRSP